jgi:hypothetical protein
MSQKFQGASNCGVERRGAYGDMVLLRQCSICRFAEFVIANVAQLRTVATVSLGRVTDLLL